MFDLIGFEPAKFRRVYKKRALANCATLSYENNYENNVNLISFIHVEEDFDF